MLKNQSTEIILPPSPEQPHGRYLVDHLTYCVTGAAEGRGRCLRGGGWGVGGEGYGVDRVFFYNFKL
jgi:hypothetical protein